jgi:hypothetical protein
MPSYTIQLDPETAEAARLAGALTGHQFLSKFIPYAVAQYAAQVVSERLKAGSCGFPAPRHPVGSSLPCPSAVPSSPG